MSIEFIQITDAHVEDEGSSHWQIDTYQSCRAVLATALARHPLIRFVISTGDMVDKPGPVAYQRFANLFSACPVPVYRIPGNHDDLDMVERYLSAPPFRTDKHVELSGWRLLLLNSQGSDDHSGELSGEEIERLRRALADSPDKVMILLHHHPVPIQSSWMDAMGLKRPGEFLKLMRSEAHRVKAVAFGHVHQDFETLDQGIRYLGSPSTCLQFEPGCDRFTPSTLPPGYRWFRLETGGEIETRCFYIDENTPRRQQKVSADEIIT